MFRRHTIAVSPTIKSNFNISKSQSKSTYRDWIKFFLSALIPFMIGIFTVVTTILQQNLAFQQREQDQEDALLLREQSERQANNIRQETIFSTYIDDVSNLLLIEKKTENLIFIRMKTLTSLRQLNSEYKQYLFLFLYESELIYRHSSTKISSLLNLNHANLNNIFFQGTIEVQCSFIRLYIPDVYLSNSTFIDCYIDRSTFSNAIMYKTTFLNSLIIRTSFKFTLLNKANFSYSKLNIINFSGSSLIEADFTGTTFIQGEAIFINTNLTGAILSLEQINNLTLYNAILPNGTWGLINTKNLVKNGDGEQNCSINGNNFLIGWNISNQGEIKVLTYDNSNITTDFGRCYFRVTSFYLSRKVVYISQRIILEDFALLISAGLARYHASANVQCFAKQYVIIQLRFIDYKDLQSNFISSKSVSGKQMETIGISNILPSDVREVILFITFIDDSKNTTLGNDNYCICDNVKFSISKI